MVTVIFEFGRHGGGRRVLAGEGSTLFASEVMEPRADDDTDTNFTFDSEEVSGRQPDGNVTEAVDLALVRSQKPHNHVLSSRAHYSVVGPTTAPSM